ncbi:MAG: CYTH domain-containing protein [Elusimicrobiales bacterium]
MSSHSGEEIEFKWAVSSPKQFGDFLRAAAALGAASAPPRRVKNTDYYLDTAGRALEKSGVTCRLRASSAGFELTEKSASRIKGGLARRAEHNFPLPGVKDARGALELIRSVYRHPAARGRTLETRFRIENGRRQFALSLPGKFRAQACFDNVMIFAGPKTVGMREIELEFKNGRLRKFLDFCRAVTEKSGLSPARMSKVATARAALKYLH